MVKFGPKKSLFLKEIFGEEIIIGGDEDLKVSPLAHEETESLVYLFKFFGVHLQDMKRILKAEEPYEIHLLKSNRRNRRGKTKNLLSRIIGKNGYNLIRLSRKTNCKIYLRRNKALVIGLELASVISWFEKVCLGRNSHFAYSKI